MRNLLRSALSLLATLAIKKHKIRVAVILGQSGSDMVKEILYTVLKEKENVRRNIEDIWWDLSVPLNILGYDDKQRNIASWLKLLFNATVALIKNRSNPHLIILNADTGNENTAKYWSKFLKPEYTILLDYFEDNTLYNLLSIRTAEVGGKVILKDNLDLPIKKQITNKSLFTYGGKNSNLQIETQKVSNIKLKYKKQTITLPKKLWPAISMRITGSIFALGILEGHRLDEIAFSCLKYTFPKNMLRRIKSNLLNFA